MAGAVALQQVCSGAKDPGLLEVLAIHQTALQVLKLAQQRNGLSFELVVAAAVDQMTRDAGRKHQRDDQRSSGEREKR